MKYFLMSYVSYHVATTEFWNRQERKGKPRTQFRMGTNWSEASVWTEDEEAEQRFRRILNSLRLPFEEDDEQQVYSSK